MGEVTSYPNGTFCWVDLGTVDVGQAKEFYGGLFGWEMEDVPTGPDATYTMCRVSGKDVAGVYEMPEQERAMAAPHWNSYVSVDDVKVATDQAKQSGATVVAEPFDVLDRGLLALIQDPGDAIVCLWEARSRSGAGLVNEPNTWTWNDLATRDPEKAIAFYSEMFGWSFDQVGPGYWSITRDPLLIGGMRTMDQDPPQTPPHWMPYFVVENIEQATARIGELGGRIIVPPREVPAGRFAVFSDPAGAFSAIFEMGTEGAVRGVDAS
jgi:predicted enzyme related to lactoylglutathione lyase